MSLEQKIELLTAAVERLTAAMSNGASTGKADTAEKKTEKKTETKATYEPKHTMEELQALGAEIREKLGMDKAKELRTKHAGEVAKLSEIKDPKVIDACFKAFSEALEAAAEEV